jgi:hypothetical protein
MTWGTLHPTVLVPAAADGWSAERRRVVLLHELAHVARRDCLAQMVAALACALYWIHPGVWYAARRMRVERELACDDRVLAAGTRARSYAAHLLEVARAFRPAGGVSPVAVSMARPSHLEGRMLAVLDAVRSRRTPSRAVCAGLARRRSCSRWRWRPCIRRSPRSCRARGPRGSPWSGGHEARVEHAEHVVEHTIAARPGGRLDLVLEDDASVHVVGWERATVFVHAEFTGERATEGHVDAVGAAGGVRVRASRASRAGRHDKIRIWVPKRYDVAVTSPGGGVFIREVEGRFTGTSGGDGLHLSKLRGTVDFATEGGGLMVALSRLDGQIRTSGAGVMMDRVTGSLDLAGAGTVVRGTVVEGSLEPRSWTRPTRGTWTAPPAPAPSSGSARREATASRSSRAPARTGARPWRRSPATRPPPPRAEALARIAFQETDPEVQREAAESLASLPNEAGLAGLLKIARSHPGEEARREAAEGLGVLACDESIAALRQMAAGDRDPGVQGEAVEALAGTLGRDDVPRATRDAVRAALREIARSHPNPDVRARARTETRDAPREMSANPTGERLPLPAGARELALRNAAAASGAVDDGGHPPARPDAAAPRYAGPSSAAPAGSGRRSHGGVGGHLAGGVARSRCGHGHARPGWVRAGDLAQRRADRVPVARGTSSRPRVPASASTASPCTPADRGPPAAPSGERGDGPSSHARHAQPPPRASRRASSPGCGGGRSFSSPARPASSAADAASDSAASALHARGRSPGSDAGRGASARGGGGARLRASASTGRAPVRRHGP